MARREADHAAPSLHRLDAQQRIVGDVDPRRGRHHRRLQTRLGGTVAVRQQGAEVVVEDESPVVRGIDGVLRAPVPGAEVTGGIVGGPRVAAAGLRSAPARAAACGGETPGPTVRSAGCSGGGDRDSGSKPGSTLTPSVAQARSDARPARRAGHEVRQGAPVRRLYSTGQRLGDGGDARVAPA